MLCVQKFTILGILQVKKLMALISNFAHCSHFFSGLVITVRGRHVGSKFYSNIRVVGMMVLSCANLDSAMKCCLQRHFRACLSVCNYRAASCPFRNRLLSDQASGCASQGFLRHTNLAYIGLRVTGGHMPTRSNKLLVSVCIKCHANGF